MKLIVAFGDAAFLQLSRDAKERGISVQELLRAVVIPDYYMIVDTARNERLEAIRKVREDHDGASST